MLGFEVQGLGFRVKDLGLTAWGLRHVAGARGKKFNLVKLFFKKHKQKNSAYLELHTSRDLCLCQQTLQSRPVPLLLAHNLIFFKKIYIQNYTPRGLWL